MLVYSPFGMSHWHTEFFGEKEGVGIGVRAPRKVKKV